MKYTISIFFILLATLYASQLDMLQEACDDNKEAACYDIAQLYDEGIGFEQNSTKAKTYYIKSCNLGSSEACNALDRFKN